MQDTLKNISMLLMFCVPLLFVITRASGKYLCPLSDGQEVHPKVSRAFLEHLEAYEAVNTVNVENN